MVQIRKPVQLSQNLIDLSTKAGAEGRATNRLARNFKARELAEDLLREAIAQAMAMRRQRPR